MPIRNKDATQNPLLVSQLSAAKCA